MPQLTGPTAEAFERGGERYNAAFAAMRKAGTPIDDEAFMKHLGSVVVPIVDAAAAEIPERASGVLDALFTVSLELFASSLLGPKARHPAVASVWTHVLPKIAPLLMRDPRRVAASLSNAGYNIGRSRGARPGFWLTELLRLAPQCTSVQELLEAGKIAAWRAGMPQYRDGALASAQTLAPTIAAAALDLARGIKPEMLVKTVDRLRADPWAGPADALAAIPPLKLAARAGAFRGFGGDFTLPPKVWSSKGCIYVNDGEGSWQLFSDRFGWMLARIESPRKSEIPPSDTRVTPAGLITWGSERLQAPINEVTSWASDGITLAVTVAMSHHVYLFARTTASPDEGGVNAA